MTIAMKALGYRLISPPLCRPWTRAMPTVGKLRGQRVRWTRGALDDLRTYGRAKVTRTYIMAQIGRLLAMISPPLSAGVPDTTSGQLRAHRLGHPVGRGQFRVRRERVVTVRKAGRKAMLISGPLFPELFYDWFMAARYLQGAVQHLRDAEKAWKET